MKLTAKEKKRYQSKYGPWAIVTGASSGIGEEIARQLANCGLNLILVARSARKLDKMVIDLSKENNIQVKALPADLSSDEGTSAVIAATEGMPIGLLVASAGFGTSGSFLHTSIHEEVQMVRVNCESLLVLTHHYAQVFAQQQRGGIILLSSMLGFHGAPLAANYGASKAYVQSLAEALSVELKSKGVDVLAAAPGPVKTGFENRANMQMGMTMTPAQVGVPILKALGKKGTVLPGLLTKLLVYTLRTAPRWGRVRIMKQVMGGMTKHQLQEA